jgi:spore coat polysaccharide biosynthesis predicted glycosyltransferase SpsG
MLKKKKILLYFDYDSQSGYGHISRTEAFFESINLNRFEVFFSSKINPTHSKVNFEFLNKGSWVDLQTAKQISFDLAYIDTYSLLVFFDFENVKANKKVALVDGNFYEEAPIWVDLLIILEQAFVPIKSCNTKYISGLTLIKNKIHDVKINRMKSYSFKPDSVKAIVNFGGSNHSKKHLLNLEKIFTENPNINYIVFCAQDLVLSLLTHFSFISNLEIRPIDFSYYDELISSDFLITSPGTSFMESIYIGIPVVLFNLFDSSKLNFSRFRHQSNVLFSGELEDLSTNWIIRVLSRIATTHIKVSADVNHNFLNTNDLALALDNLDS